jgi:hypothetical protein
MASWARDVVSGRYLVASLGEAADPPWWRSQATSEVGLRFLQRLFPRTAALAALETAGRAASIIHDQSLARIGHYHLFRLPIAAELALHDWLRSAQGEQLMRHLLSIDRSQLLDQLAALAGDETVSQASGPIRVGLISELHRPRTVRCICSGYLAGFRGGTPTFPYLAAVDE